MSSVEHEPRDDDLAPRLLEGVEVVEISCSRRAAAAGAALRDLGASVTRVAVRGERASCGSLDAGKRVVTCGHLAEGDVVGLLDRAEILVEDLDEDPLAVSTISRRHVHVTVTALGKQQRGHRHRVLTAAESGLAWDIGIEGRPPMPAPMGVTESLAGFHAAAAALWLHLQQLSGAPKRREADIAEVDVIGTLLGTHHLLLRFYGGHYDPEQRPHRGDFGTTLVAGCLVDSAEGSVFVMIAQPSQLERLRKVMPPPFDEEFPTYRDLIRNQDSFRRWMQTWAAGRRADELLAEGEQTGFVVAPFLTVPDLAPGGDFPLLRQDTAGHLEPPAPWQTVSTARSLT